MTTHGQWEAVQEVCQTLRREGFQALLAGGCVRDLLMGREPNDFDVATDAVPDQVHAIYPHALTVGKAFGVTILPFQGFQIEVATFREDLEYRDGRRPEGVRFATPEEDAKRRDFTVNALFYDIERHQILDFVGGEADILARVIRTVGRPDDRFEEDRLRLLRAIRFSAQLDFAIAPETHAAILRLAPKVSTVSRERVRDEISKMLKSVSSPARRRGMESLASMGLLGALFPKLAEALAGENSKALQEWLSRWEIYDGKSTVVGLSLFFFPVYQAGHEAEFRHDFLKGLRLDNKQIEAIVFVLTRWRHFAEPAAIRRGELLILLAHRCSQDARRFADIMIKEKSQSERNLLLENLVRTHLGDAAQLPEPLLTGNDLKSLGVAPGSKMGEILHEAFLLQIEGKISSHDDALAWVRSAAE